MERIRDISKVAPGDFINYQGSLAVVVAIEFEQDTCTITLDNKTTITEKKNSRLEFFRTLNRFHSGR